ncbi:oxidoreductase [Sphaerisporangium sp. NPDC005288]|uniref:oxidoreductase n=1 Tax=Sphaerisporangium sp. NPDC005288 TaxID=3155114 RepID=UPI0033B7B52B
MTTTTPGGSLTLAEDLTLSRMGYGAMQLAGPGVFGPPKDRDQAVAVLREAVRLGVTHIDTADFYGPAVVNELIRQALHPYPDDLRIVTKVGATRGGDGSWIMARSRQDLIDQVHANLTHLGVEALDVVNLRVGGHTEPTEEPLAESFGVLAELRRQGLIRHLGVSGVTSAQLTEAQGVAPVVTVQNLYNIAQRGDDALVDRCAREGIAFQPFFPLGGFTPLQSDALDQAAARIGATPQQVALAWLLRRSATMTVIPGTSSPDHLRENIAAADLVLTEDTLTALDAIGA